MNADEAAVEAFEQPSAVLVGSCDAGDCDRLTDCMVWDFDAVGWLSMCAMHGSRELRSGKYPVLGWDYREVTS